jgi:uncharacterized membrane protein YphA (DoxX/SURF4 family)
MNTKKWQNITGWALIVTAVISAYLIIHFRGDNLYFLSFLLFEMVLAIRFKRIFSPAMIRTAQIVLGLLFLFSGFSKGVDPLGTAYRIEDYFIAYQTEWMMPAAVFLSFVLNAAELLMGALLLFNIKPKQTSWLVLLMMILFTLTTFNDALNNPVPDCGCFGDALIMTNWQTFYKNLVILIFVMIVFFNRRKIKNVYSHSAQWAMIAGFVAIFIGFQYLNYSNLPMLDFRPWKVGNKMIIDKQLPVKYYLTYKNKKTGEVKEYLSPDFPYDDPRWIEEWEYVSQRVEDPNVVPGMNLAIINENGEDVTRSYLNIPDFHFFVVSWDLAKADKAAFRQINFLHEKAIEYDISMIVLTASFPEQIKAFKKRLGISEDLRFFNADDVVLKAMIRANPGLILMKDGKVIEKWHHRHLPGWDEIEKIMKAEN